MFNSNKSKVYADPDDSASTNSIFFEKNQPNLPIEDRALLETKGEALRNKVGQSPAFVLLQFSGTAFSAVFSDWQFWLFLALFWIARGVKKYRPQTELPDSCGDALNISQDLLQWTLCFYVEEAYQRFNAQLYACQQSMTHIMNICDMSRQHMSQTAQWRVFRHLNAAYVITYVGFGDEYTEKNLFAPFNEKYKLLTVQELERIKVVGFRGSSATHEILSWVIQVITIESKNVRSHRETIAIVDEVLLLRGTLEALFHFADFPMPFSYRHFISMTLFLFLPSYAYSMGYSTKTPGVANIESFIEFVYVFFFTVACLAVRMIGIKIHDPFGDDAEDFPVMQFVSSTVAASYKVLCAHSIAKTEFDGPEIEIEDIFRSTCVAKQDKLTPQLEREVFSDSSRSLCSDSSDDKKSGNNIHRVLTQSQKRKIRLYQTNTTVKIAVNSCPTRKIRIQMFDSELS